MRSSFFSRKCIAGLFVGIMLMVPVQQVVAESTYVTKGSKAASLDACVAETNSYYSSQTSSRLSSIEFEEIYTWLVMLRWKTPCLSQRLSIFVETAAARYSPCFESHNTSSYPCSQAKNQ